MRSQLLSIVEIRPYIGAIRKKKETMKYMYISVHMSQAKVKCMSKKMDAVSTLFNNSTLLEYS